MPWPVYTESFIASATTNAWVDFVVPPGHRAILKWVSATHWGAATGELHVQVANAYVFFHAFPASTNTINVPLLAVAYAGQRLSMMFIGDSAQVHLTGYLFTDPSGRAGPPAGPALLPEEPHGPIAGVT